MNPTLALMQREWLQHRFAWSMLLLIPVAVAALGLIFGQVDVQTDDGAPPALALAAGAIAVSLGVLMVLVSVSGLLVAIGLARRDHADRSVEFWLSLPISHTRSLLVPMAVHLLLVPVVTFGLALLVGVLMSLLLVARVQGVDAWLQLPWAEVLQGALVALARIGAGWPMMVLWLSPLVLLAMLMYAWMRRWGLVVLGLALAVGSSKLGEILGYRMVPDALARMGNGAVRSLISGNQTVVVQGDGGDAVRHALQQAPSWLLTDIAGSLQNLASPAFAGGLLVAGLCFYGLVQWRRRGASTAV
jgi:hypothetical protein